MAPYSDDIQSPDWLRDYPSNGGDAIAYQKVGHLWDVAVKNGVTFKNFGEYIEYNTFLTPMGSTKEPKWIDFYNDTLAYEAGAEPQLYNYNTVARIPRFPTSSTIPSRIIRSSIWASPTSSASISGIRTFKRTRQPARCLNWN